MCKIYKVKFHSLDSIYKYTNQVDVADVIAQAKICHAEITVL